jgi:hypothetical protein
MQSEQINNGYCPEQSTVIRPGKIRLGVYAERMGKMRSAYRFGPRRQADEQHYRVVMSQGVMLQGGDVRGC